MWCMPLQVSSFDDSDEDKVRDEQERDSDSDVSSLSREPSLHLRRLRIVLEVAVVAVEREFGLCVDGSAHRTACVGRFPAAPQMFPLRRDVDAVVVVLRLVFL